jgi:hypothetical protein
MRVKSRWFKGGREKTPQEIAGALAFIIWRISDNALKNVRKADFDIAIGDQYFSFLSEFLIFLVQVADRIAYVQLSADMRLSFTTALANRVAEIQAENQTEWLGKPLVENKRIFITQFNQRAGEYAEFEYSGVETSFSFVRYLGYCMTEVVDEKDKTWVIDQIMAIEVPDAVAMLEKAMTGLFEADKTHSRTHALE